MESRMVRIYNYRVWFFKKTKDGREPLGHIDIDDAGVGAHLTFEAKAFRHAPAHCSLADAIRIERLD